MASRRAHAAGGHAGEASSIPRVFINYRREDASGHAGRLYDALAARLGREHVFMDVDAIRPGENFAEVLDRSVESCDVLIALIGRRWASAADREGRRRLERPEDYVRLELQTALGSDRTRVIPALVQGAEMPSSDELPESMRALSMRQAIDLSDARWGSDVDRLIRELAGDAATEQEPEPPTAVPHRRWPVVAALAALAAVALAGIVILTKGSSPKTSSGQASSSTARAAKRPATKSTPTITRPATPARATIRYARHSTAGYQALLPTGASWSVPSDTAPVPGRLFRTSVRNPDGAFVIIDYTPSDKPQFGDSFESKTTVGQTAFGSATKYVFRGGKFPECARTRCIDYQVSVPGTAGGLAVLAGGPRFSETQSLARTVAESLTAPSGG